VRPRKLAGPPELSSSGVGFIPEGAVRNRMEAVDRSNAEIPGALGQHDYPLT